MERGRPGLDLTPLLCHFGTTNEDLPKEMIEEMKDYLPEAEMHFYAAGHAFANVARPSFAPAAAELAHQRSAACLDKVMA